MGALFGILVVVPCVISIAGGGLILLGACIKWLKTAVWEAPTLHDGLVSFFGPSMSRVASTGYLGLDQIVNWALGSPLALWLIFVLPIIWFFGGLF
jgi:hypothetical protein